MRTRSFTATDDVEVIPTSTGVPLVALATYAFTVAPRRLADPFTPSEPASISDVSVTLSIAGVAVNLPGWLYDWLCDARDEWLLQQADAQHEAAADDAADHRRELLREDCDAENMRLYGLREEDLP